MHLCLLVLLLTGMASATRISAIDEGTLWNTTTSVWYWLAIFFPIAHQMFVLVCWRIELHTGKLTGWFGRHAFPIYAFCFSILGIGRVVLLYLLAYSNRETIVFQPLLLKMTAIIMLLPAIYLFYSVKRYFGFRRAFGIDHFDVTYRTKPFVREGIFKYTQNGMYTFGFFLLWVPGLWFGSAAALLVALFEHLYIWVHYFSTEKPDMRHIYGGR